MTDRDLGLNYLVTQAEAALDTYCTHRGCCSWTKAEVLEFVKELIGDNEGEMMHRLFPDGLGRPGIVRDDELALDAASLVAQHQARLASPDLQEQLDITPMEKRLGFALREVLRLLPDGLPAPERDFVAEIERRIERFKGEKWADEKGKKSVITGMRIAQGLYQTGNMP